MPIKKWKFCFPGSLEIFKKKKKPPEVITAYFYKIFKIIPFSKLNGNSWKRWYKCNNRVDKKNNRLLTLYLVYKYFFRHTRLTTLLDNLKIRFDVWTVQFNEVLLWNLIISSKGTRIWKNHKKCECVVYFAISIFSFVSCWAHRRYFYWIFPENSNRSFPLWLIILWSCFFSFKRTVNLWLIPLFGSFRLFYILPDWDLRCFFT